MSSSHMERHVVTSHRSSATTQSSSLSLTCCWVRSRRAPLNYTVTVKNADAISLKEEEKNKKLIAQASQIF